VERETRVGCQSAREGGFTFVELLVVVGVLAVLAAMLIPALANTQPDSRLSQCLNNERQIVLGWRMYADDNNDVLAPNDYPFSTKLAWSPSSGKFVSWVAGTMANVFDATDPNGSKVLVDARGSRLAAYVTKDAAVYKCPGDELPSGSAGNFTSTKPFVRSYSMNSAVGTLWGNSTSFGGTFGPIGAPVKGGWLPGAAFNANQTAYSTYGKMTSLSQPGPAGTFVIMDENSLTINDCTMAVPAVRGANGYLIDYPASYHNGAANIAFADGHALVHKWQDRRTYTPVPGGAIQFSPNNLDTDYLAGITSAAR